MSKWRFVRDSYSYAYLLVDLAIAKLAHAHATPRALHSYSAPLKEQKHWPPRS
jgi:hypothetical protein